MVVEIHGGVQIKSTLIHLALPMHIEVLAQLCHVLGLGEIVELTLLFILKSFGIIFVRGLLCSIVV